MAPASPRPTWATVGRMSSPGLTCSSTTSPSTTPGEEEKGLRASVATSSPRLLEYGSPGRCGGSGLGLIPGNKGDLDIIRFFTARDILDLINNLQKSAQIATDEASSLHGSEQANRVKAKCSKVCGLANRLIDLYVATIKAKVARILRKLGLGQARGQELLYHHLIILQALVDKAFASFNAVQHAEAARIKQGKLGVDARRENSPNVTWRTPAERKPSGLRPGSLGSLPQPAENLDVKDLLLEARRLFLLMAEELVDLKNKLIVFDRSRIHEAVVAAVAEGDVPDPLPKVKTVHDGVVYGFNTRYVSDGGSGSGFGLGRTGSPRIVREAGGSPSPHSPRASRLMNTTFDSNSPTNASRAAEQQRAYMPSHSGLRSVSQPGDGFQSNSPSYTQDSLHALTPRSRMAISHGGGGGDSDYASNDAFPASQATARDLFRQDDIDYPAREATLGGAAPGIATCHAPHTMLLSPAVAFVSPLSSPQSAQSMPIAAAAGATVASANSPMAAVELCQFGPAAPHTRTRSALDGNEGPSLLPASVTTFRFASDSGKRVFDSAVFDMNGRVADEDAVASPEAFSRLHQELQARTATSEILSMQAARVGQQLVRLTREIEDGREALQELALEALRLVQRDPKALESSLGALNIPRGQLDEASARCQARDASRHELQSMLRTCLTLLGQQLCACAGGAATSPRVEGSATSDQSSCARCGELAALLDQIIPLLNSASAGDRTATADLGPAPLSGGLTELASDGSQDEVVMLPPAADIDTDAADMANEALVAVLQRLNTVLERLRRLEEESAEMEQKLQQERQVRTDAEANAARLQADRKETSEALVFTQQCLFESEQQLEQLRAEFAEVQQELGVKSVEIADLQQRLQHESSSSDVDVASSKRATASPSGGMDLLGVNVLTATEIELEGLRLEHENLRVKTALQGAELRHLHNEISGLRAARDKLVEELQEMQLLMQQREGPALEDVPLLSLKPHFTLDAKAAARASPRGAPGAVGAGKDRTGGLDASVDLPMKKSSGRFSEPGQSRGNGRVMPTAPKSKGLASQDLHSSISTLSGILRSPGSSAVKRTGGRRVSLQLPPSLLPPGPVVRRSVSSSGTSTPRDHYCALARLEEVQVQLAQAEAARQALECQLQAARSVIASKDSELDTANMMLREYERRRAPPASPARSQAAKLAASVNVPLLQLVGDPFADMNKLTGSQTAAPGGDAMAVLSIMRPGQPAAEKGVDISGKAVFDSSARREVDLIARLEELQAQCEELICRAADLDTQRNRAQLDAGERAAELEATKEYIKELEDEAECLRELANQANVQMLEKEQDVAAQEDALHVAREALARAQADCDIQIELVEVQAAQLELAQSQLEAAQARVSELEARDEEQSRGDAKTLARLREEVTHLQFQYAASQAALAAAGEELAAARAEAAAADQASTADRRAVEELRVQAADIEFSRLELAQKLAEAEDAQSNLASQLAVAAVARQELSEQLEAAATAREDARTKLASREAVLVTALSQLGHHEAAHKQLEAQLEADGALREELMAALAVLKAEQADLQRQLVNDRTAVRDLSKKLEETEKAWLELADKLETSDIACRGLEHHLAEVQESCREHQESLATTVETQARKEKEISCAVAALKVAAAQLATTAAARDRAYATAVSTNAARQELQLRLEMAEADVQRMSEKVRMLEQQLQRAQESEARMQLEIAAYASARATEAEDAVTALQAALSDVQARLEAVRSEAAVQAGKVATLEAKLAQAALERERLELAAATAAAHTAMLDKQLRQAKAENTRLEEELAASRAAMVAQEQRAASEAVAILDQLAAARVENTEQAERFVADAASVKSRLETALAGKKKLAERSAKQVAELEELVAVTRAETAQQAGRFVAEASRLETQLISARAAIEDQSQQSAAVICALEERLAGVEDCNAKQAARYSEYVAELEEKLTSARSAMNEHSACTSACVENLESQLVAALEHSMAQAEGSATQVEDLMQQLVTARAAMAEQAHASAARATDLEEQLAAARSDIAALIERSAVEVDGLVKQLEMARETGAGAAAQAAEKVAMLETQLAAAQTGHAELAERSAGQVAELEARLVATLAENTELANRSAVQAAELEAQLAAALAMVSENNGQQTAALVAQLDAARAELAAQAARSSADAVQLIKQLEAAHAEIAAQMQRSAARASELEQRLSDARAENSELLARSAAQSAHLEAQIGAAQAQHAQHAEASAVAVTKLEEQLSNARSEIAAQIKQSAAHVEALEEQLVRAHTEYAAEAEHAASQTRELEELLVAAQAAVGEQLQNLTAHAAALESELEAARADSSEQTARLKEQAVQLEERLAATRAEREAEAHRYAARMAELEAQLAASNAENVLHAGRAASLAASFEEQMATARQNSADQAAQMQILEAELRRVVFALGAAKASHDRQAEDVRQLRAADAAQKQLLDLCESEARQLKESLSALEGALQEREATVAEREMQLAKARQELETAVAALTQSQATVAQLQAAVSLATAVWQAAANAAAAAADEQDFSLVASAKEHARLQELMVALEGIAVSQARTVCGLQDEVAALQAVQDAAAAQVAETRQQATRQDTVVADLRMQLAQQQQALAMAELDAAAARAHDGELSATGLAGEDACTLQWELPYEGTGKLSGAKEMASLEMAAEAAQRLAEDRHRALAQAERHLAAAEGVTSQAQARQRAAEADVRVLQELRDVVEVQAAAGKQTSFNVTEQSVVMELKLAGIQRLLENQRGTSAELLESLTATLAAADSDLHKAKARVAELQGQLQDATGRVWVAEQAAVAADAEKRQVEAQLAAAIADSNDGRAMVQDLTAELARYREEVERVRMSLVAKQTLLDLQEPQPQEPQQGPQQQDQHNPQQLQSGAASRGDGAAEALLDADLAEDFLEGCIWGMGLGGQRAVVPGGLAALWTRRPSAAGAQAPSTARRPT